MARLLSGSGTLTGLAHSAGATLANINALDITELGTVTSANLSNTAIVYPSKTASNTYAKGGHIIQSWYRENTSLSATGSSQPNVSSLIMDVTCQGGNFLHAIAAGGYVGVAGTVIEQKIGFRFTENSVNTDQYGHRHKIAQGTDSGTAQGYYTVPSTGSKTVSIYLLNWSDDGSTTVYWQMDSSYSCHIVIYEIQG